MTTSQFHLPSSKRRLEQRKDEPFYQSLHPSIMFPRSHLYVVARRPRPYDQETEGE